MGQAKRGLVSQVCPAGLVHASFPILVGGNTVAVLETLGLAREKTNPAELTALFRRFFHAQRGVNGDGEFEKMLDAFEAQERFTEKQIDAAFLLIEVLAQCLSTHASRYRDVFTNAIPASLVRAMEFAKNGYSDPDLSAIRVAAEAGLTRQRLAQLFRKFMGMTYAEWIVRHRLSVAMAKLRGGADSILDIADTCGFGTVSSFYRAFQRFTGVTPNRYRLGDDPRTEIPFEKKRNLPKVEGSNLISYNWRDAQADFGAAG